MECYKSLSCLQFYKMPRTRTRTRRRTTTTTRRTFSHVGPRPKVSRSKTFECYQATTLWADPTKQAKELWLWMGVTCDYWRGWNYGGHSVRYIHTDHHRIQKMTFTTTVKLYSSMLDVFGGLGQNTLLKESKINLQKIHLRFPFLTMIIRFMLRVTVRPPSKRCIYSHQRKEKGRFV